MKPRATIELLALVVVGVLVIGVATIWLADSRLARGRSATQPPPSARAAASSPAPSVTVPPGAAIPTRDQAVAYARGLARDLGARDPHLVSVELVPLRAALEAAQRQAGEDPALVMEGQNPAEAMTPVWRVQFDNDQFRFPSCPRRENEAGTPLPCPSASTATFIVRAGNAGVVRMTFGSRSAP